jgi:hypothetical protein
MANLQEENINLQIISPHNLLKYCTRALNDSVGCICNIVSWKVRCSTQISSELTHHCDLEYDEAQSAGAAHELGKHHRTEHIF